MRECAPPGVIGFNWNECQTTFMQGRAAMWWDGIGFSAPLLDPTKSKVVDKVGFAPDPAGKVRNCATFIDGIGIPATAKNKKPAWLFVQWVDRQADAERGAAHRLRHAGAAVLLRAAPTSSRAARSRRNGSTPPRPA